MAEPIFTPLFTAALAGFGSITIIGNLTVAGLASAIATGGGFMEFSL